MGLGPGPRPDAIYNMVSREPSNGYHGEIGSVIFGNKGSHLRM